MNFKIRKSQGKQNDTSLDNISLAWKKLSDIIRNKVRCNELREIAGQ